jgi:predicted metalloprotease with PDZ domain
VQPLRYEVDLQHRLQHLVGVTMTIPADLSSGARITVPTWTPGSYVERDYVHHLQQLTATDAHGAHVELEPNGRTGWSLPADVVGPVTLQLEWYANELTVRTNHVDDHHALLVAPATFPYVHGAEDRGCELTIVPTDDHKVYSLLPTTEGHVAAHRGPATFVADDMLHLVDSAFEVGNHPQQSFDVDGVPHRWVHASHAGTIDLDRIESDVTAISRQARLLFDDELPIDSYTFLCVGADAAAGAGGLEHRDGSVLMLPALTDATDDGVQRTRSLIAHEYLHLWNVKRLVPAELVSLTLDRPTHTTGLWVAEGWTAYYDDLIPTRADLQSPRRYLDVLRDDLRWVQSTPGARRQSVTQASWHAWTGLYIRDENSVNAGTSYYTHGAVLAACLDLLIRGAAPDGDGLDEAFRLLWRRFGHHQTRGYPSTGYTLGDVTAAVSDAAGRDLSSFVREFVEQPGEPPLEELLSIVGIQVTRTTSAAARPDLGMTLCESDRGATVASVLRGRAAWAAGITGGDRLIAVDGMVVRRGELDTAIAGLRAGASARFTVERGPRLLHFVVELGEPQPDLTFQSVQEPTEQQHTAFARWTGHPLSVV